MNFRARVAIAAMVVVTTAYAGFAIWRASRAVGAAEIEVRSEAEFEYSLTEVRPIATNVEYISSPSVFHDLTVYKGRLFAAGPGGLFEEGSQSRVGELLPPSPLTSVASGITSLSAEPELWIGTASEGMLAFDGSRFRHIRPKDARYRNVTSVLPLAVGRILFGTEKAGVLAFDGRALSFFHDSLRNMHVTTLAGNDTDLWIGTIDRGLLHWSGGQVATIANLPDKQVLSIAAGPDGRVFVGTGLGIAVIREDAVEQVLGDGVFAKTLTIHQGHLYVGTLEPGIYEIPLSTGKPRFLDTPSRAEKLFGYGEHLLAAAPEGIFEARQWSAVLKPASAVLTDRNISAVSVDPAGELWVGFFDRGLDVLDPSFTRVRHLEDEHLFCINRIVHGRTTAVATANGLVLFDATGQKRQLLGREQGLIANHVTDVAFEDDEIVAATPAGLSFIGNGGVRSLYAFHGLVNNHAYALGVADHRLLAGTLGGLSLLSGGAVQVSYTTSNSPLKHNWITAIASIGSDVYLGTYGAGVCALSSDGLWHTFQDMPKNTEVNPGAMVASPTHVYAGTLGKGLLVYDVAARRWNTITRGLPSLNVTAVHLANGRLYAGTDNGLVRLP